MLEQFLKLHHRLVLTVGLTGALLRRTANWRPRDVEVRDDLAASRRSTSVSCNEGLPTGS